MNFNCFIDNNKALLARNVKGCRYFHFPDDILPDYQCDFVLQKRIKIIGGVFMRNYGAFVFEDTPKNLSTLHFDKKVITHQKTFDTDILAVKVGLKRIITLLVDKFYIHTNIFHSLQQGRFESIPPNPKGIFAYADSERLPYFACPWYKSDTEKSPDTMNTIAIMNIESKKMQLKISGTEPIVAITFSETGTRLAAANASGKEFLIYDTHSGNLVAACNHGSKATINSLVFTDCENYLLSTSNSRIVNLYPVILMQPGDTSITRAESFIKAFLPEGETGTGSIMAVKSLMNIHEDFERLRVMIITATSHMHLYIIRTVPATCFLGEGVTDTTITFEKTFNLLQVKWKIKNPFIPLDLEGPSGSAYDASDASEQPADDKRVDETTV